MEIGSLNHWICVLYFQVNLLLTTCDQCKHKFNDRCVISPSSSYYGKASQSFEALSRDGKIAVGSSVTLFIVTLVLFFTCSWFSDSSFLSKKEEDSYFSRSSKERDINILYYDDVVLEQQGHELELKENVAYAPVR